MNPIVSAQIYLDDDVPDYMAGIIRVGSVNFFDEYGEEIEDSKLNNELVDNAEFRSDEELINSVAKRIGIHPSYVEIVG